MKITAKKSIIKREIVSYREKFEVRVQVKPGKIVTVEVETEDGTLENWEGKTPADRNIISSLKTVESNYLGNFLEEQDWD
jgi:hypothetical protein